MTSFIPGCFSRMVLAVSLATALVAGLAAPTFAGSGTPASKMFKKKTPGTSAAPATQNWAHGAGSGGKATTVTEVISDGSVSPFLLPDSADNIQTAAEKYAAIVASGGWPDVPNGKMRKGATGKSIAVLNRRLNIEGYLRREATEGEFADVYTTATEAAVKTFQRYHGLAATGTVDGPTRSALNVSAKSRLSTIRANVPRIAEYSKDLGDRYVVVNVPAMQIETVSNGKVYSRHNAIVGRPSRPTPVVMTPLETVRFNPYWNAPHSIVERDIVPRMISSGPSKIMKSMNMKIFNGVGGPEVNPNSVNWRRAVVDNYHFRQEPGGSNAMATAKIEFKSPFGIYLHDTPEPHLFNTGQRFYSSGCVRVENVATFINWIFQGQDGIDRNRISELAKSKERLDETIAAPPQLRVTYLTAWPTRDGVVAFRPDVYELDGSGFVVGQPLPVGETQAGKRYVLKPIPRSPATVDADEAVGFASLFGRSRNPDKQEAAARTTRSSDQELESPSKSKKSAQNAKKKSPFNWISTKVEPAEKKAKASKTAKSKKILKKKKTKAAALKCKADKNGKKPAGCKKIVSKKPVAKPEKTASAAN